MTRVNKSFWSGLLGKVAVSLAVFLQTGCASKPQTAPSLPQRPAYFSHTVQYPGETLGSIARWYTGSSSNWQVIKDANPEIDPRRIRKGMSIQIPQSLVVNFEPLPRPNVDASTARKQAGTQEDKSSTPQEVPQVGMEQMPSTASAFTTEVADGQELPQPPTTESIQEEGSAPVEQPQLVQQDSQNDMAMPSSMGTEATFGSGYQVEYQEGQNAVPQETENKQGLVKGILEAVGNASLDSKKQAATTDGQ
jgi:hypothetical protein